MNKFTHLHLHTHYSLLDGLTRPSKLMARIKELGMDSVAITDHGNMYGAIEFYKAAKGEGIKPIIGCEVYIVNDMGLKTLKDNEIHHLILLAMNNTGYGNLMKLVSEANLNGFYYKPRIDMNLLAKYNEGLICLSGCLGGQVSQFILKDDLVKAKSIASEYKKMFGDRYYIEVQRHPQNAEQNKVTPLLIRLAKKLEIQMVATCDSHYLCKEDQDTHEILLAVQTGKNMDSEKRMSLKENELFVASPAEIFEKFKDIPEAIENSQKIAERCNVEIELHKIRLPRFDVPKGHTPDEYLSLLSVLGLKKIGLDSDETYADRLDYELEIIAKTGFSTYMLIVSDMINWAKSQNIAVGPGRGSAAGSLISYCLGITNIDPIKYGLLFERFMNPERISMPDIDIDLEDTKRDQVIQYVANKYGKENVAQIITFGTIYARSGIRDVGRVLKFDLKDCDRIAKYIPFGKGLKESLDSVPELKNEYSNPEFKRLLDTAMSLEGTVRHASKHACGVVLADKPITDYSPVQNSRDGNVMTQYEMHAIEDLGLLKIDFLGLRNLSVISECARLVEEDFGFRLDMNNLPLDDIKTFRLLQEAKTTSVFQLESSGMKRYLKELKPTDINDISAMVSLYRPGPMELIPRYIARKYGKEKIEYLYPSLEPVLKDTYGIMIYQEQLIKAVQVLAGFTLAQADVLRKAIGKKIKKLLDEQEGSFKEGCAKVGTPKIIADKFWALVEPFNRYGFNKSHAVSYAMIAYQTAYLKSNFPIQFMVAEMNSDTNIDRIGEIIDEIHTMGIKIASPDVNISGNTFVSKDTNIRFAMSAIKGMSSKAADIILEERKNGDYNNLENFLIRTGHGIINKKSLELLAKSGAVDSLSERNSILENIQQLVCYTNCEDKNLLPSLQLPDSNATTIGQKLSWEKELIGLYLSANPANNYYQEIKKHGVVDIKKLEDCRQQNINVGGIITNFKKTVTRNGKILYLIKLLDTSGEMEIPIFSSIYERHKDVLKQNNVVVMFGKLDNNREKNKFTCLSVRLLTTMS